MLINYVVILCYLAVILFIGFYFRKVNTTVPQFLRANGELPWFWVGASAFVSQFSASSFTYFAAEAYTNKYNVIIPYLGNAVAFLVAGIFFARKMRQLGVNNPTEAIAMRFGKRNASFFAMVNIPSFLIYPAIWLSGLAVFTSAMFNISTFRVIIIIGIITVLMSALGGAWAVISSDFIQTIVIMFVSCLAAAIAIFKFNEIGGLFQAIPLRSNLIPQGSSSMLLYSVWVLYMFLQKILGTNNINNLNRFSSVDSSIGASRAAFLAMGIYLVGMVIWFIPVWFISTQYSDLGGLFPNISRANQTAYLVFVQNYMPAGMLGIVFVALMSATMSSVDSSLSWCTGYILGLLKNKVEFDRHNIHIGKLLNVGFGCVVIVAAMFLDRLWQSSFFELTYNLVGFLYIPLIIPLFLAYWIKRTPDWAFMLSIAAGLTLSFILSQSSGLWPILAKVGLGIEEISTKDTFHIRLFFTFILQCILVGGIFLVSTFFYDEKKMALHRLENIDSFYSRLHKKVYRPTIPVLQEPRFLKIRVINILGISFFVFILVLFIMG